MDSMITQEVIDSRAERLLRMSDEHVTHYVTAAVNMIAEGAMDVLQGLSAADDGVTRNLWRQAIYAAENGTDLVFPGWDGVSQPAPSASSYEIAINLIAGRVARAILIVNGMVSGFDSPPQYQSGRQLMKRVVVERLLDDEL